MVVHYVTVSAILPMLQLVYGSILKEEENDSQLNKDIKRRVVIDLLKVAVKSWKSCILPLFWILTLSVSHLRSLT